MTDASLTVAQFEALVDLLATGLDADAVAIVDDIDALVNATGDLSAAASVTIDGAATVDQIQALETALGNGAGAVATTVEDGFTITDVYSNDDVDAIGDELAMGAWLTRAAGCQCDWCNYD